MYNLYLSTKIKGQKSFFSSPEVLRTAFFSVCTLTSVSSPLDTMKRTYLNCYYTLLKKACFIPSKIICGDWRSWHFYSFSLWQWNGPAKTQKSLELWHSQQETEEDQGLIVNSHVNQWYNMHHYSRIYVVENCITHQPCLNHRKYLSLLILFHRKLDN